MLNKLLILYRKPKLLPRIQPAKVMRAHLHGTPYVCLTSVLLCFDSKWDFVRGPYIGNWVSFSWAPKPSEAQPQVGRSQHCIFPTYSPLSPGIFLSCLKQENWLLDQHSFFFQSYCLTYYLCQEFHKFILKLKKLRINSFVLCSIVALFP